MSKETLLGYSYFSRELIFVPKAWMEKAYPNLSFYKAHEVVSLKRSLLSLALQGKLTMIQGGHFAALEQPESFLKDTEEWLQLSLNK